MSTLFPFFNKFTKEEVEIVKFIYSRFGYKPKSLVYFQRALTHKSIASSDVETNERLEFLGDAILDAVVAEFLYKRFPEEDEGYLTKIKSKIVNRRTLGDIAHEMQLSSIMNFNNSRSIKLQTIEGNAFEALIGAIYLDGGYLKVQKSIEDHIFKKYVNFNQLLEEELDFKSKLFIWCQKNKLDIVFEVVSEENFGHEWKYVVEVIINEKPYGRGIGSSKKKAEQVASKEALELIGEL